MPEPEENGIRLADRSASALRSSRSSEFIQRTSPKSIQWNWHYAGVLGNIRHSSCLRRTQVPLGKIRQNSLLIKRPGSLLWMTPVQAWPTFVLKQPMICVEDMASRHTVLTQRQIKEVLEEWYESRERWFHGKVRDGGWQTGPPCSMSVKSPGALRGPRL